MAVTSLRETACLSAGIDSITQLQCRSRGADAKCGVQLIENQVCTPCLCRSKRQAALMRSSELRHRFVSEIVVRCRPCVLEERLDLKLEELRYVVGRDALRYHV